MIGRERTLGTAEKRRYDLPLDRGSGAGFLTTLVALMTLIAMLALAASFALSAMTHRWSSGLENHLTIEIPTQDAAGRLLDRKTVTALTQNVADGLRGTPGITAIHPLSDAEINKLIEPWLGQTLEKTDFPVPGLVSIETALLDAAAIDIIRNKAVSIAPNARLDTHREWLGDLLRFTGAMKLAAIMLVAVIGLTTVTAVSGAVRSRLAINRAEVELLHLIGASDKYITGQFQRHTMTLALRGAGMGAVACIAMMLLIGWTAGQMGVAILPDFRLDPAQLGLLALTPFAATLIAMITARWTVTRVLGTFP